jgi:hypothetical protein
VWPRESIASAHLLNAGVEELPHTERKRSIQSVQSIQRIVHNFVFVGGKSLSSMLRLVRKQIHYPISDKQFIMFWSQGRKRMKAFSISGQLGNTSSKLCILRTLLFNKKAWMGPKAGNRYSDSSIP